MIALALKLEKTRSGNFVSCWFNNQIGTFETERSGRTVSFLTAQSFLGSIACMFGLQEKAGDLPLILAPALTIWSNSMFIAKASAQWCLIIFYLSLVVNTALLLIYIKLKSFYNKLMTDMFRFEINYKQHFSQPHFLW